MREDSQRVVKVRGVYVRRPMAHKVGPEHATLRDVIETLAGIIVLGLICVGFWLWMAIAVAAS